MKFNLLFVLLFLCGKVPLLSQHAFVQNIQFAHVPFAGKLVGKPVVKVVLALPDTTSLGYIHKQKGNETIKLIGEPDATEWLNREVQSRFGKGNGASVLWVVKMLSITTDSAATTTFLHLSADLYTSGTNKAEWSRLREPVDTLLSCPYADTASCSIALTQAIDLLYLFSEVDKKNKLNSLIAESDLAVLSEDEILKAAKSFETLPVWSDSICKVGVYNSFKDFLNNSPSIKNDFWVYPDTSGADCQVKLKLMGKDSSIAELVDAWGVCFGGNELYKLENGFIIPIERSGNSIVLSRYQEPAIRRNQGRMWNRVVSSRWPEQANPFSRKRSWTLDSYRGKQKTTTVPVATKVDLNTGELTF